jgi:hypothetical protein
VLQITARLENNEVANICSVSKRLQWGGMMWILAAAIDVSSDDSLHIFAKVDVDNIVYSNYEKSGDPSFTELTKRDWDITETRLDRLFYVPERTNVDIG